MMDKKIKNKRRTIFKRIIKLINLRYGQHKSNKSHQELSLKTNNLIKMILINFLVSKRAFQKGEDAQKKLKNHHLTNMIPHQSMLMNRRRMTTTRNYQEFKPDLEEYQKSQFMTMVTQVISAQ
jgi:hypothetical protein